MRKAIVNTVLDTLKKKIVSLLLQRIMAKLLTIPFLSFGPVAFIVEKLVSKFLWLAADELMILAKYMQIDVEVNAHVKKVKSSLDELIKLPETATKEEEDALIKKVSDAYDDLISIG